MRQAAGPNAELDALMQRLAGGDRGVFSAVFRRLWPPLSRLCRSLLNDEAEAADAAQEAMQKVFERAADYDPSRAALPWALALAAWECRTLRKKRARRREVPETELPEAASEQPDAALGRRRLIEAATIVLGTLSERDRATLLETFAEETSGIAGATLRKRRQRALARFRLAWRRLYGGG